MCGSTPDLRADPPRDLREAPDREIDSCQERDSCDASEVTKKDSGMSALRLGP